jgi:hypothetical protein
LYLQTDEKDLNFRKGKSFKTRKNELVDWKVFGVRQFLTVTSAIFET